MKKNPLGIKIQMVMLLDVMFVGVSTVVLLSLLTCGWCTAWHVVLKRSPLMRKVASELQTPTMEKREAGAGSKKTAAAKSF